MDADMTQTRTPWLPLLVLPTLLAACLPNPGMPGSAAVGAADLPKPGDVQTFIVRDGDQDKQRLTYRAVALEDAVPGAGAQPTALVLETVTPGVGAGGTPVPATATEAEVKAFLRDHWDAHVGGKDDAGVNGQEFQAVLAANGLDIPQFLQLWRGSRLSLADFTRFWTVLDEALGDADHPQAVRDLRQALGRHQLTLGDLIAVLAKEPKGTSAIALPEAAVTTFFQRLQAQKVTVVHLFTAAVRAKKDLATTVQDVLAMKVQAAAASVALPDLESYTPTWLAVDDGKTTNLTGFFYVPDTSIMFPADCTSYTTALRSLVTSAGVTVAQWRLYAKAVCYPSAMYGMSGQTRIGEIGVQDLSFPDSRYRAYLTMGLDTNDTTHWVSSTLKIATAGLVPFPVCLIEDGDELDRRSGFHQPSEVKLAYF
jgi:hypothetical protein